MPFYAASGGSVASEATPACFAIAACFCSFMSL